MTCFKSNFRFVFRALVLVVITAVCVYAQPAPDNPPPPADPPVPDDQPVPITGIEYLLVGGGILGGYKLLKNRNKVKNQ